MKLSIAFSVILRLSYDGPRQNPSFIHSVGSLRVDEIEELLPRLGVIAEDAGHRGCHRLAVDLLDTSHNHAHVPVMKKNSLKTIL